MIKKITLLILCFTLLGCSPSTTIEKPQPTIQPQEISHFMESVPDIYDNYIPMLNTMVKLNLYDNQSDTIYDEVNSLMRKYHQLLDSYHYYRDDEGNLVANVNFINDYYGLDQDIEVSKEMIEVLKEAILMAKLSEGYFNPLMGEMIHLWSDKFSSFPIENTDPTDEEITKAKACVPSVEQFDSILVINEDSQTVRFNSLEGCENKVSINLGAFSKGYVAQIVSEYLKEKNITFLLDAGTSTVSTYGNRTWTAGVRSPYNKVSTVYALELNSDEHLSTSGDDNQYFLLRLDEDTTIIRCHILNPFEAVSNNYYRSVSVISGNAAISDVLSTALFSIHDEEQIQTILNNFKEVYNIDIDVAFVIEVNQENEELVLKTTPNFKEHILQEYVTEHITEIKEIP